ncbi:MAG: M14 family metallopeptidase [Candidatus Methylumidiphilus sp.]
MLSLLDALPAGFFESPSTELHRLLGGPTLIHLPGRRAEPLFVSILLHGNEDTGLKAMQQVLGRHRGKALPRCLSLFVGNVQAAREGMRRLDGQPDYNRVWPGCEAQGLAEEHMMAEVVEEMRRRRVFASIDIHNNTGLNPHYACINHLDQRFFHLATLFSRIAVYFVRPVGVQAMAFAELCPSVTVECGKAGASASDGHAAAFVEAALRLDHFPVHPVARHDLDLYHTVVLVKVPETTRFTFGRDEADIVFEPNLDHFNFTELRSGTSFGRVAPGGGMPLQAFDDEGRDVAANYFEVREGELLTRQSVMPAMLTSNERIIRQDCLCYLMERLQYECF